MKIGDICHLNWTPNSGSEMASNHYGVILSSNGFNTLVPRLIVAPITSKDYKPFGSLRVPVESLKNSVHGFICIDQIRSVDPDSRGLKILNDEISYSCKNQCKTVLKKIFGI